MPNVTPEIFEGDTGSGSIDPGQYNVIFHNVPSSFFPSTAVHASQYTLPAMPRTETLTEKVTYQEFSGTSAYTSKWNGGTFTVSKVYTYWHVQSAIDGLMVGVQPGTTISFSTYTNTAYDNTVHVYANYKYNVTGTFSKGCYEYKNIQLTGNLGYETDNTVVSLNSQVRRFYSVESWTSINGLPINDGGIPPGTEQTFTSFPTGYYTEGNGFYVTGQWLSTSSWKIHDNSKTLKSIGTPTTRPDTTSSYTVYLETSPDVEYATEQLQVSGRTTYKFKHWSLTPGGQAADLTVKPTSNTTLYAVWDTYSDTGTYLPKWDTPKGALVRCKEIPGVVYTLNCYRLKNDTVPYLTTSAEGFEYRPPKHVGWQVGSEIFAVGSLVTKGGGTRYQAIWEPDDSKPSSHLIFNNEIDHPVPTDRTGYKYIGLTGTENGAVVTFNYPDKITFKNNMNLYAIWECTGACRILTDGNQFKTYHLWIYDGTKWKLHMPKIFDGINWKDYA